MHMGFFTCSLGVVLIGGCQLTLPSAETKDDRVSASPCAPAQLAQSPLVSMFDGSPTSLAANWHTWGQNSVNDTWSAESGDLVLRAGIKFDELVLSGNVEDFVLRFDWQTGPGGNSGVKYNVREATGRPVGFEYQIIDDDVHPDAQLGQAGNRKTAALYDVVPRAVGAQPLPAGSWNTGCIVFQGRRIEHWLNGGLVLKAALDDPDFVARVAQSKFKNEPDYLVTGPAQIFLQDHGDAMRFRDVRLLRQ